MENQSRPISKRRWLAILFRVITVMNVVFGLMAIVLDFSIWHVLDLCFYVALLWMVWAMPLPPKQNRYRNNW